MSKIEWEFSQPLESDNILDDFEIDYAFRISDNLRDLIKANNGGIPNKGIFDSPREGMVFAGLLSFNKDDEETVYMVLNSIVKSGKISMVPFGTDGFGNLICMRGNEIVFWNHESDKVEIIADSLFEFLDMLHE